MILTCKAMKVVVSCYWVHPALGVLCPSQLNIGEGCIKLQGNFAGLARGTELLLLSLFQKIHFEISIHSAHNQDPMLPVMESIDRMSHTSRYRVLFVLYRLNNIVSHSQESLQRGFSGLGLKRYYTGSFVLGGGTLGMKLLD